MDVLSQQESKAPSNIQEISRAVFLAQKTSYWNRINPEWNAWLKREYGERSSNISHHILFAQFVKTMSDKDLEFALQIVEDEIVYGKPERDRIHEDFGGHVRKEVDNRIIENYLLGSVDES